MKRLLLCSALLLFVMLAESAPVSREQALQKAQAFVAQKSRMTKGRTLKLARQSPRLQQAQQDDAYSDVFNVGDADGFVVVSGDDRTPAILGYATGGTFNETVMPENMKAWIEGYERQLKYLETTGAKVAEVADHDPIEPMLTTTWDQTSPYNNKCPYVNYLGRTVTGCVATAMAQVLNYYAYPEATVAEIPAYTTETRSLSVKAIPANTPIDWDNMLDSYSSSATTAQKNAVANLMLYCGASVQMNYNVSSSGAPSEYIAPALKKYFGYASSTHLVYRDDYRAAEWDEIIYYELDGGRPVLYSGYSVGGGHEFVIDGYDHDGFYHVNWGWGGDLDGYFLLSILNPESSEGTGASASGDGFSYGQDAIIGMTPDEGELSYDIPLVLSVGGVSMSGSKTLQRKSTGKFTVTLSAKNVSNDTGEDHVFKLGLGVFDMDNKMLESYSCYSSLDLGYMYYYPELGLNNISFGKNLPNGTYRLKVISGLSGSGGWYACRNSDVNSIEVKIEGNTARCEVPTVDLDVSFDYDYAPLKGIPSNVTCTIENNGTLFLNTVFLQENGEDISGMRLELDPGTTGTLTFEYKPKSAGSEELSLVYYDSENVVKTIGKTTVTVGSESGSPKLTHSESLDSPVSDKAVESETTVLLSLTNEGTATFSDDVCLQLYKYRQSGSYYSWDYVKQYNQKVRLSPGESKTVEMLIDGLEDKSKYKVSFLYYLNNKWVDDYSHEYVFTTDFSLTPVPVKKGDANGDGEINVTDVTSIISYILGKAPDGFNINAADANSDGEINVSDVTAVINMILGK